MIEKEIPKGKRIAHSPPRENHSGYNSRPSSKQENQQPAPRINPYMDPKPSQPMKKKAQPSQTNQDVIRNENVISAILSLIKDLNGLELEFVKREINSRLGTG
jgi:hypothetical protein